MPERFAPRDILALREGGGASVRQRFTLLRELDGSASATRYAARKESGERGVLREFHPMDPEVVPTPTQGGAGMPCAPAGPEPARSRAEATEACLKPYRLLSELGRSPAGPELSDFAPAFEIYRACDAQGEVGDAAYVWRPEAGFEPFDRLCAEIHRHPERQPERKLFTVLRALRTLTGCVCALHRGGLAHGNLAPAGFGFVKRGGARQALTLLDAGSPRDVPSGAFGTGAPGFTEPEAAGQRPDRQTDIYSIGAMLFYAVIVTDETRAVGFLYRRDFFDRIPRLVAESELIRASEANAHPRLRDRLSTVLRRCLCARPQRYPNCEALLDDLSAALYYALPSEIARKCRAGAGWNFEEAERLLDAHPGKDASLALLYHLCAHPLYQKLSPEGARLNALIVGFGSYGQKFLDACLQVGQMWGVTLDVTVASEDVADWELYLSERPGLAEFFDIDGASGGAPDSYGRVRFRRLRLGRNEGADLDALRSLLPERGAQMHRAFVALGEDGMNLAVARQCLRAFGQAGSGCAVSYAVEDAESLSAPCEGALPLYVREDLRKSPLRADIERMAFNVHLIREEDRSLPHDRALAGFRERDCHRSRILCVLSIKAWLHGLGIEPDEPGPERAARRFAEALAARPDLRDELIWLEHRRWVSEKLCLGWQRLADLNGCPDGVTEDPRRKLHVRIAHSRPAPLLAREFPPRRWDEATGAELAALDELDRTSVELHRACARRAKRLRAQDPFSAETASKLRAAVEDCPRAASALRVWFAGLKEVWRGHSDDPRLCASLRDAFLEAAQSLPEERRASVRADRRLRAPDPPRARQSGIPRLEARRRGGGGRHPLRADLLRRRLPGRTLRTGQRAAPVRGRGRRDAGRPRARDLPLPRRGRPGRGASARRPAPRDCLPGREAASGAPGTARRPHALGGAADGRGAWGSAFTARRRPNRPGQAPASGRTRGACREAGGTAARP